MQPSSEERDELERILEDIDRVASDDTISEAERNVLISVRRRLCMIVCRCTDGQTKSATVQQESVVGRCQCYRGVSQ